MQRPFSAYEGNEPYVFVCYAHEDRASVYPEIARLHESGFNLWYDEGIAPGSEWSEILARQIKGCHTFLYFVTPQSVASEHCRSEVSFALEQACGIIAVHLHPTQLPDGLSLSLSNRQAILKFEYPRASYESKLDRALQSGGQAPEFVGQSTIGIGEWTLNVGTERLIRDAEERALDPKELSVLLHLIDRAPDVVSTQGLLSRTWPNVVVGDNVLHQAIARLRNALGDDARQPRFIETLPKRGYRLCAQISGLDDRTEAEDAAAADNSARTTGFRDYRSAGFFILFAAALAGLALLVWQGFAAPGKDGAERLRIAVESFTHPSDNQRLEDYATLLHNEVTYHLGRLAQPSMDLTKNIDAADFVATGSLTAAAGGVRLFVQVVNTQSGVVHWSKALELPDPPTQDLIATRPEHLATLVYQVATLSRAASRMTESTEAVREFVAGIIETSEQWQGLGGDWHTALARFKRAHELDPEWILPPLNVANLYVNRLGRKLRYADTNGPIDKYTRKVLDINEDWTWLAGWVNLHDFHFAAAPANFEHARRNGWPASGIEFSFGLLAYAQGHLDNAIDRFSAALEMGAAENQAMAYTLIAASYFADGRFAAAAQAAEEAVNETDGTGAYAHLHAVIIQIYAQYFSDDLKAARETLNLAWATYGDDHPERFAGALALLGTTERARKALSSGDARWAEGEGLFPSAYFWGYFYLGELESAFKWLDRAIEDREIGFLAALRRSPILDPIRTHPRVVSAMARLAEIEAQVPPIKTVAYP